MQYHIPCSNCSGLGYIKRFTHVEGGICFECDGSKFVEVSKEEYNDYHQEQQKKAELKKQEQKERQRKAKYNYYYFIDLTNVQKIEKITETIMLHETEIESLYDGRVYGHEIRYDVIPAWRQDIEKIVKKLMNKRFKEKLKYVSENEKELEINLYLFDIKNEDEIKTKSYKNDEEVMKQLKEEMKNLYTKQYDKIMTQIKEIQSAAQ